MTAPDRIWLVDLSLWTDEPTDAPSKEEYIRKGAFPVEEIIKACANSFWEKTPDQELLHSILSLLESDDE